MTTLSILLPTYNDDCTALVKALIQQADSISGLAWELIVADDVSTDRRVIEANRSIALLPHCRYLPKPTNDGRAAIRNFLVDHARGQWLLFIDADLTVVDRQLVRHFVEAMDSADIICGGYRVLPGPRGNLRHRYEWKTRQLQTAGYRSRHPWANFKVSNTLFRREVLQSHRFDERFQKYGYEDVLLGKSLQAAGYTIRHIDAPVGFNRFESNDSFVSKTLEAMDTLCQFHDELVDLAPILRLADRLSGTASGRLLQWLYRHNKSRWRRNLCSANPSLLVFKLYKMGYLLTRLPAPPLRHPNPPAPGRPLH